MGRPRLLRNQEEQEQNGDQPQLVNIKAGEPNKYGIKPFVEGEELPAAQKNGKGEFIKPGDKRYYLSVNDKGIYKLIFKQAGRGGANTRMVKTLKPKKRTEDKVLLNELRAIGVPVI